MDRRTGPWDEPALRRSGRSPGQAVETTSPPPVVCTRGSYPTKQPTTAAVTRICCSPRDRRGDSKRPRAPPPDPELGSSELNTQFNATACGQYPYIAPGQDSTERC